MKRPAFNPPTGLILLVFIITLSTTPYIDSASANAGAVSDFILKRCQYLEQFQHIPVCSTCVASQITIPDFYKGRNYQPAWTNPDTVDQMFKAIHDSYRHGLNPEDYHLSALNKLKAKVTANNPDPAARADFDILLTDALLRLSFHLFYGKVSPESLDPNWNFERRILDKDPANYLAKVIGSGDITRYLDKLYPHHPYYLALMKWLSMYREFAKKTWPRIPAGRTLRPGMKSVRVKILKTRLESEGYFTPSPGDKPNLYTPDLVAAVKDFQTHHRLEPDGLVGRKTIAQLNIPAQSRVDQIRVNMERARWLLHNLPKRFLLVNIAAFEIFYYDNGKEKWSCRVMVGKPFWKTPIFRATMKYIVLNPYWVVPPGILRKEVIPKIKRDISYLEKNDMEIVDLKGHLINPASLDWEAINPARFPYIIRQKPGPKNALGRIKFIFPNKHFVFLHDTPARNLFSRPMRAFSHGCIRIERPLQLAEILFRGSSKWNLEKIKKIIRSRKTTTIHLEHPIPILILYWTVIRNQDDTITFLPDIYHRDPKILAGLNTPLKFALLSPPRQEEASRNRGTRPVNGVARPFKTTNASSSRPYKGP